MNTPLWSSTDLETLLNGKASADFEVSGVSIDSRSITKGDLFIALAGPTHDGHNHTTEAFINGAAAILVHKDGIYDGPVLRVSDTMKALEALGCAGRDRAKNTKVIGITGSVGKTGTKDMLGEILAAQDSVHISQGSHNNHWGVPLTLSRLPKDTTYAVQEMGMNHAGELAVLTSFAKPDVAVITTVGPAHLEFFEDIKAIVDAKCEVFKGLTPNGTAVLNRDHAYFGTMEKAAKTAGAGNIITFGTDEAADLRLISAKVIALCTEIEAQIGGQDIHYKLPFIGTHWAMNSLAALGAAIAAGADPVLALETLENITVPAGRGAITEVPIDGGEFILIDESYNANPQSLDAAIDALAAVANMRQIYNTGRAIAVLGDMLELGATSKALHVNVAETLSAKSVDLLLTCGEDMGLAHEAAPKHMQAGRATTAPDLIPILTKTIKPGDVVMIKGSNSMHMNKIVAALKDPTTYTSGQ